MFNYSFLNHIAAQDLSLIPKLDSIYEHVLNSYPQMSRFSVALMGENSVSNYYVKDTMADVGRYDFEQHELRDNSSLTSIAYTANVRIVSDLRKMLQTDRIRELIRLGHRSSYTYPISYQGKTIGFIFVNAKDTGFFTRCDVERDFAYLAQVVANQFIQLFESQRHFQASLEIALKMGHARDPETKEHLTRMGMYSELLARFLSKSLSEISHQFIHRIRLYAPFHDIGKYMIPDDILYSDRRFTPEERAVMNNHTIYGEEIIDEVIQLSGTKTVSDAEIQFIKNIVRHHHECFNGKGLPDALRSDSIPLEARIVTLADVFDALLSKRAYKPAWELSEVIEYITFQKGQMFDPMCVDVLLANLDQFMEIRSKYLDKIESRELIAS
ncbi:HD domain-containing phosphohydrolase [Vibrio sinaloensis]|uniref:HD domain-containing phosphohydrolase n=1 Tax=Photobacterium sp. (strain ATCC 43367) TaxID=379097 RepID=UPI0022AEE528|nr:HD domain-containing phosphohydrolase [Vibrio sinaloensis]MCZ4292488.1 HD domain-containing protein [Vibrio sinaloensis]